MFDGQRSWTWEENVAKLVGTNCRFPPQCKL